MFKSFNDYTKYLWFKQNKYKPKEDHHVMPIALGWWDYLENIATVLKEDHKKIHDTMDIPFRQFNQMVRKQRMRENWKVLLEPSDWEWRSDMQELYLEWYDKLKYWWMKDMHDRKIWAQAINAVNEYNKFTWDNYIPEIWNALDSHWLYITAKKELSKEMLWLLKKKHYTF